MYILAVVRDMEGNVTGLHLDTLGVTNISSSLVYLEKGLVFVGSHTADLQLINNHSNINSNRQVMAVTASGTEKDGTIRLVRNVIVMMEHTAVELGGIKGIWNVRKSFWDVDDSYLIQSYVGETRILGVVSDDGNYDDEDEVIEDVGGDDSYGSEGGGATLAEVNVTGIAAATSTLFVGNVYVNVDNGGDSSLMVKITQRQIRLISVNASKCLMTWEPEKNGLITVASAKDSGQIVVALR